jgi:hypothetical protein
MCSHTEMLLLKVKQYYDNKSMNTHLTIPTQSMMQKKISELNGLLTL